MAAIDQRLPEPYDHIEVSVTGAQTMSGKQLEPVVHVMDLNRGQGHMLGVGRAEAEARVILDTIRQYRGEDQPLTPDEVAAVARDEISRLRTQVQTVLDLGALADERQREARAEAWREGFITSTGMDRGYSSAPGSFPWAGDDEDLDAWNPYTGDGYRDPYSDDEENDDA